MDEIKYNYEKERVEAEESKVKNAITNFKIFFLRAVYKDPFLKRLKEAVNEINDVAIGVGEFYMLVKDLDKDHKEVVKSAMSSRETSSLLNVGTHVFGREKEKHDIIKMLLNPDCKTEGENFTVLPIIGFGGVGKTTLVQLVYNDPNVEKYFELRMWVCISNNFDVVLLTKKLYESAFKQRADFDSFDLIQEKLKDKLKSRRFLVVFDDVWNDNDKLGWEKLVAPLKNGKSGSMMLLTTRLKAVARLTGPNVMDSIILEGLNDCGMWNLFKECSFGGEDPQKHKELVEIGRDIVKKLKGSPLAAKTVGGILCSDLNEVHWRSILESELWSLEQGDNDIIPALRLTYQYLPSHLKPCFSFCSIFPQDHVFHKHDLVNMWIALGMVPRSFSGVVRPEDVGSKYFDDMLSKSIFIRLSHNFEKNIFIMDDAFVMHDLIHDLSILVSQGECLRTSTNKLVHVPNTVRHLYAHIDGPSHELGVSCLKNLRTLILHFDESHHPKQDSLVAEILKGTKSLRLLIFFAHNLSEVPESASKLLHLRYLYIGSSSINAIPKSVSKLYLLETIVYDNFGTRQLKQVDALGKLINLRHLIAPEWLLDRFSGIGFSGIGRLTSLQELSFIVGKDLGFKICELRDMRELRSLRIDRIENVGGYQEVIQANLKNKVNLNELSLTWTPIEPNKPHLNEDVLDHLEPPPSLKELTIRDYKGTGRPPIWFTTLALSKLACLTIHNCNFVHLPCLEQLPLLKYIYILSMNAIKRIIHECNQSSAVDAFPSLERLSFDRMRALEEWCVAKQPNKWMQCLKKLDVLNCPNLRVLPPIPVGVKELSFKKLGLNVLPNLVNYQSSKSESLPDLVAMSINSCENIVSLTEGLLQNPERFVALEELNIYNCEKLISLPSGGFSKLNSLKKLSIGLCRKIDGLLVQECFLPSSLHKLKISSCGNLDSNLPKALESIHSLSKLELRNCANITSLPPKEVFSKWKTLKKLILYDCTALTSLESLFGLFSIEYMEVRGCSKLSSPQQQPPSPSSIMETGKTSAQEKPMLSVDKLDIDDPLLLSVEPIRNLSAVRKLIIEDCSELQSLPELPPLLQELYIYDCCPKLRMRCEKSGPDWLKLSQIPKVIIEEYNNA
ncbi:putative disease resistance protein RGA4 [Carex rostrata]